MTSGMTETHPVERGCVDTRAGRAGALRKVRQHRACVVRPGNVPVRGDVGASLYGGGQLERAAASVVVAGNGWVRCILNGVAVDNNDVKINRLVLWERSNVLGVPWALDRGLADRGVVRTPT